MSVVSRSDGPGGKMYVPRDRYSLMMSFCVVPASARRSDAPCSCGDGDVEREQPHRRRVDRHRRVGRGQVDAVEERPQRRRGATPARRPGRPRRGPARGRGRSRSGSAGRRRRDSPVWPLARLRRNSALLAAAEEWPAYVRITQGRSRWTGGAAGAGRAGRGAGAAGSWDGIGTAGLPEDSIQPRAAVPAGTVGLIMRTAAGAARSASTDPGARRR